MACSSRSAAERSVNAAAVSSDSPATCLSVWIDRRRAGRSSRPYQRSTIARTRRETLASPASASLATAPRTSCAVWELLRTVMPQSADATASRNSAHSPPAPCERSTGIPHCNESKRRTPSDCRSVTQDERLATVSAKPTVYSTSRTPMSGAASERLVARFTVNQMLLSTSTCLLRFLVPIVACDHRRVESVRAATNNPNETGAS